MAKKNPVLCSISQHPSLVHLSTHVHAPNTGTKEAGDELSWYGAIVDRRKEPFCPEVLPHDLKYQGSHQFVFVVSNGHTGTTFFGQQSVWRENFVKGTLAKGIHIAHEQDADAEKLKKIAFSEK